MGNPTVCDSWKEEACCKDSNGALKRELAKEENCQKENCQHPVVRLNCPQTCGLCPKHLSRHDAEVQVLLEDALAGFRPADIEVDLDDAISGKATERHQWAPKTPTPTSTPVSASGRSSAADTCSI